MDLIIQVVLLLVGFLLLIKGADWFVAGSSDIAKLLKIPTMIVGLTIVSFGTSAPEAAVSVVSSLQGSNALAISNVIGSNIFNLLAVLGMSAIFATIALKDVIHDDFPYLIFSTILVIVLITDVSMAYSCSCSSIINTFLVAIVEGRVILTTVPLFI